MFRLFTLFLVTLLTLAPLSVLSAPVPVPGRVTIKESRRSSPFSAAARALGLGARSPLPAHIAQFDTSDEGLIEAVHSWVKREAHDIAEMVERAEHSVEEFAAGVVRRANGGGSGKFAPRNKLPSQGEIAAGANARLSRARRSATAAKQAMLQKRTTPNPPLTSAALGKCFYVGSDFLMHDCNEVLNAEKASLNSAKTPEQLAIAASLASVASVAKAKATATS